jgi:hypothetical protein
MIPLRKPGIEHNPFETHGIEHLSPSSINLFAASPALFVLEKCLKLKQPVGAAAHRGTAVEAGVVLGLLTGATDAECAAAAQATYSERVALCGDPRRDKERDAIVDMTLVGLKELRGYGVPSATQGKIERHVEGLAVPIIGYFDAEWDNHGILIDLKTTHRIPSEISTNHARQVALYASCRSNNFDIRICYVSTKKAATYRLENATAHVAAIDRIALTIQRFLSVSDDPQELVGIVAPDVDSFYFADPGARQAVFSTWGF